MMGRIWALLFLSVGLLHGQDTELDAQMRNYERLSRLNGAQGYKLGAGDLIQISVFNVAQLNQEFRISSSGRVSIPLIGKVEVAGRTGEQVEELLAETISEKGLIKDPQVSVFIKEYRSQPVYVVGAVNQPGQYMITHQLNLLDVLTLAGGVDQMRAAGQALIQRRVPESETGQQNQAVLASFESASQKTPQVVEISLEELLEGGELALNVPVQGGDVINVPERRVELFYVIGEVTRAGAFELPRDEVLHLTQALGQAGGPARTAKLQKSVLVRYRDDGTRQEMALNYKAILNGDGPDLPLRPNDVIFIPGSTVKTIGLGLLNVIPNSVAGSLIWRGIGNR